MLRRVVFGYIQKESFKGRQLVKKITEELDYEVILTAVSKPI